MSLIKKLEQIMGLHFGRDRADDVPEEHICFTDASKIKMLSIPESSPLHGYIREILKHTSSEYTQPIKIKTASHVSFYIWDMLTDSIKLLQEISKEAISLRGGTAGRRIAIVSFEDDDHPLMLVAIDGDEILASVALAPEVDEHRGRLKRKIKRDLFRSEEVEE